MIFSINLQHTLVLNEFYSNHGIVKALRLQEIEILLERLKLAEVVHHRQALLQLVERCLMVDEGRWAKP